MRAAISILLTSLLLATTSTAVADGHRRATLRATGTVTVVSVDGQADGATGNGRMTIRVHGKRLSIGLTSKTSACIGLVGTIASRTSKVVWLARQGCPGKQTQVAGSITLGANHALTARFVIVLPDGREVVETWKATYR